MSDKVQVKIEADAGDFQGALQEALSTLTETILSMKKEFDALGDTIQASMKEAADASKQAANTISDSMKESSKETRESLQGLSTSIKELQNNLENHSSINGFASGLEETVEYVVALAASIFSLNTAVDLLKRGLGYNANMEQAMISFETMLGSGERAQLMLNNLQTMAAQTPFEFGDLQDGAKKMLAFGFAAESVLPTLKAVGDAASGLGMSGKEGINRIVLALGQMQAKGKVSGEEIMQLTEAGIPAWDILAKSIGVTTAEVMKMSEDGLIPADKAVQALVQGMADRFPNMMEKQSQSFAGMMSTIRDNFNAVVGDIVKPGFEYLSETVLPNIIQTLEAFAKTLKQFGAAAAFKSILPPPLVEATILACQAIGAGLSFIKENASGLSAALIGITTALATHRGIALGMIIVQAAQTLSLVATTVAAWGLKSAFIGVALAMNINPVILAVTLAMGALAACVYYVYDNWKEFKGWCIGLWNDIVDLIADNIGLIIAMFPGMAMAIYLVSEYWDDGIALVTELWDSFTGFFASVGDVIGRIFDDVCTAFDKFADGAKEGIGKFADALLDLASNFIPDWAKSLWNQIVDLGSKLANKTAEIGNAIRRNLKITQDEPSVADTGNDTPEPPKIPEITPIDWSGIGGGGSAKTKKSGAGKKEQSEYEQAKKLYDQQLRLAEYSATEKEALYKKYLENVKKSEQEAIDYRIGLYQLDKDAFAESLNAKEIELENSKLKNEMTELEYASAIAELKRQNLEAEVNFRAKAAMEQQSLTEQEKAAQISAYQEKIQATIWYKKAQKEVLTAEKALTTEQKNIASSLADFRKQLNLNSIEDEERRLDRLREQDKITQEQLLTAKKELETQRYELEKASQEKNLFDNAKNVETMKEAYTKYVTARSQATKEMIAEEMVLNGLNAEKVKAILLEMEKLYKEYTNKQIDLDNSLNKDKIKNFEQVRDTMSESMSQAFQDVLTKSTTFLDALKNVFSSAMKMILKQFTDMMAKTITEKGFKGLLKKHGLEENSKNNNNKNKINPVDKAAVMAEQATQAQLTAANAMGNAQRVAQDQASSDQQIVTTEVKAQTQQTTELTKDGVIMASAQMAGQTAVQSIQASLQAMWQMLPMMLLMSALTSLFGGGGTKTTESTGDGINLGRNPDSYYSTPTLTGIPSFDIGSWQLPADTLAMVHKDEMIVPAKGGIADNMRSLLSNGGTAGGNSPTIHLTYGAAHYGRTNRDVQAEMKQNAKYLVKTLNQEYRNFNRGNT